MALPLRLLREQSKLVLQELGIEAPKQSVDVLLCHVLGVDHSYLYAHDEQQIKPEQLKNFQALLEKRKQHCPVAYLTGEKEFYSRSFIVNESVLIPRPATEILFEEGLRFIRKNLNEHSRVADIGTGSGVIAISLEQTLPNLHVIGSDISEAALEVAKKNAQRFDSDVEFMHCDLLIDNYPKPLDFIFANLPYINSADKENLEKNVIDFEPHTALFADREGLGLLERLIEQVSAPGQDYLIQGGGLGLEFGDGQKPKLERILVENGFEIYATAKDLQGIDRVIIAQKK